MLHERLSSLSRWIDGPDPSGLPAADLLPDLVYERARWLTWATDLVNLHVLIALLWLLIGAWSLAALPALWRRRVIWPAYGSALLFALLVWIGGATHVIERPQIWPTQSSFVIMAVLLALPLRPHWWSALRVRSWVLALGLALHALPLLWVITDDMLLGGLVGQSETMLSRSLMYVTLATWLLGLYVALMLSLHQLMATRWVPQWIDHFCATGWYADRMLVRAASVELSQSRTAHEVVERLHEIAQRLNFSAGILFWPDGNALVPLWSFGLRDEDARRWQLPAGGLLAHYLAAVSVPQRREQLVQIVERTSAPMREAERLLLSAEQLQLWLPLVSHGVLRSVLVVGGQRRAPSLSEEDEAILLPLLSQAAAAAENITLAESLWTRQVELEQLQQALATTQQRLLQQTERDRLRLAQELHDGVLQQLIAIPYLALNPATADPSSASDALQRELHGAVAQVRGLIRELRPAGLQEFGLTTALEGYVARLQRERGAEQPLISLFLDRSDRALPRPVAQCLFRVAQEALRNSLKHARANQITISLQLPGDEAILTIHDDGLGFRVPPSLGSLAQSDHFGLAGMAERVAWMDGSLKIQSEPGLGTAVVVTIAISKLEHKDATNDLRAARGRSPLDPQWDAHDIEHNS